MEAILNAFDNMTHFRRYALPASGRNNDLAGIETETGMYVWKTYTRTSYADSAAVEYEHSVLQYLAQHGLSFALPQPIPNRAGEILFRTPQGWAILRRHIPGVPLNPQNLAEVTALGAMLGELHCALRLCPLGVRPGRHLFQLFFAFPYPRYDALQLVPAHLGLPYHARHWGLFTWWHQEAGLLQTFLETQYPTLPWQVCHNDIAPNNVLITGQRVSGLLDFEFTTPAPRAFDVAMALRMTMRVWENPDPWGTISAFFRGYRPWIRLVDPEIQALPQLVRLRSVMALLLRLGCQQDVTQIPRQMQYYRNNVEWYERCGERFLDYVQQEATVGA